MNDKEILEGNRLIAEFMDNDIIDGMYENQYHNFPIDFSVTEQELQYDSSWDWLMPVVHKICDSAETDVKEINSEGLVIFELGLTANIHEVYKSVVEYIKWYNERKDS